MRACVVAIILLLAPTLHAADCTKADSSIAKAICSDPKLAAADASLTTIYRDDLAKLTSASVGLLRADQVQWLSYIQQLCHADDGIMTAPEMATCLQPLYNDRIKFLRKAVTRRDGMTFLLRTQYLVSVDTERALGRPEHPGFGTLQATWPIADTTDEDWAAWNHAVELRVLRLVGPIDNTPPPTTWSDDLAALQDGIAEAHLKTVEHDRVTTGLSYQAMGHGAAHPYESWETLTYLLNDHRALRADDVFRADAEWKQAIAEICWKQLSTSSNKMNLYEHVKGPEAKEIQQVLLNLGNWTLEPDGIHISYPEYSVSPRVAPMDDAIIHWSDVKPLLSERFVIP
jgi:uncharacterized protein